MFKSITVAMKYARGSATRIAVNKAYDAVMQCEAPLICAWTRTLNWRI